MIKDGAYSFDETVATYVGFGGRKGIASICDYG